LGPFPNCPIASFTNYANCPIAPPIARIRERPESLTERRTVQQRP
jgi:hypothetical protein